MIAWVVELVDTTDLKSVGSNAVTIRVRRNQRETHTSWGFCFIVFKFWYKLWTTVYCVVLLLGTVISFAQQFESIYFLFLANKNNYQ